MARGGPSGLPRGAGMRVITASRISSMPSPVLAEQGMAWLASMPITSSISAMALSGSACGRSILFKHRYHFDVQFERGVAVGDGLRLDTLAGIDDQQGPLAGRQ